MDAVNVGGMEPKSHAQVIGPRVLLVIPTLGERIETLARALLSIRSQLNVDVDVFLVTRSASEEMAALASRFQAEIVIHPGHISAAVNAGFALAKPHHRYVGWIGDDDMLRPDALRTAVAALESHPDAVLAFGRCDYIDEAGDLLFTRRAPVAAPFLLQFVPGLIKQEACLFRRSAVVQVGGLDENLRYTMDLDVLLKLRRQGSFVRTEHTLAAFCWHPGSLTIANRQASLAEAQMVQQRSARGLNRVLEAFTRYPIRALIVFMSDRIEKKTMAARAVVR